MKKMLITLLLAISTGSHATVLKNATDTFPLVSLQQKKVNDNITQDGKLPKASVIFWIDLDKSKSNSGKTIRNVKAKVSINKEGKIKVLEYNKKQPLLITNKICVVVTGLAAQTERELGEQGDEVGVVLSDGIEEEPEACACALGKGGFGVILL